MENYKRKVSVYHRTCKSYLMYLNNNCYIDKQIELLNHEYDLIKKTRNEKIFVIATYINSALQQLNKHYYVLGNITSSYLAYIMHIHNVDTLKYNIKPEMCYGTELEPLDFSLDYHIPMEYESKQFDILSNALENQYVYYICEKNDNDEFELVSYKFGVCDNEIEDSELISVDYKCKSYKCLLDFNMYRNSDIVEVNMICDVDTNKYINKDITIDDIDKNIDKYKTKLIDLIDFDKTIEEEKKNSIINSINSFYDLVTLYGIIHSSYFDFQFPERIEDIKEVAFRDDVYNYLLASDIDKDKAYHIANKIRKGRYVDVESDLKEEFVNADECRKYRNVKYLFRKGQAIAAIIDIAKKVE